MPPDADLLIIGGGINGAGIARDAAGRGLSVVLTEREDLAGATSSASSKLIHGGLRYLEQYEFRLVAEALAEREVLLQTAPHLVSAAQFVMPHVPTLRPAWVIRAGLLLYDYLARRQTLPGSAAVNLRLPPYSAGLKPAFVRGFTYSDCRVDDARLVIANARAAADLGATVLTRTACLSARREHEHWAATLRGADGTVSQVTARAVVNVAGPWTASVCTEVLGLPGAFKLNLVQGSHIVVPRVYDGTHAFILQNEDQRVIFAYPYENHYTVIGTTDVRYTGDPARCHATADEISYLCRAVNRYFAREIAPADVVWSYCGIRPLIDDGAANPSQVSRDYVLHVDGDQRAAPALNVFGGKITTYRRLAERALDKLAPWFPRLPDAWTADAALPGGDIPGGRVLEYVAATRQRYHRLPADVVAALVGRHGTRVSQVLGDAMSPADLGEHFGATLFAREVEYFIEHEWAFTADDVLWRRTKAGLHLTPAQIARVSDYFAQRAH
jgi:glycerol-3-phosphate dehydrogenase